MLGEEAIIFRRLSKFGQLNQGGEMLTDGQKASAARCLICGAAYTGAWGLGPCENGHTINEEKAAADSTGNGSQEKIQRAIDAFWAEIARQYPDVKNGDLHPSDVELFFEAAADAVCQWLYWNTPQPPEPHCSDPNCYKPGAPF